MKLGNRERERFWIALVVRVAFGFMFLIAAVNIFSFKEWDEKKGALENGQVSVAAFAETLSKPYESSWVNFKIHGSELDPATGAPRNEPYQIGKTVIHGFIYAMPFIMGSLSILLLTGLFLRPALRASALFLVLLGLGKYLADFKTGVTVTTLQDFMYAMFITLALFALSREPVRELNRDPSREPLAAPGPGVR
jgi:hypothetical protein